MVAIGQVYVCICTPRNIINPNDAYKLGVSRFPIQGAVLLAGLPTGLPIVCPSRSPESLNFDVVLATVARKSRGPGFFVRHTRLLRPFARMVSALARMLPCAQPAAPLLPKPPAEAL